MMMFDRKGQENFNNSALRNPASSETDRLGTAGENINLSWDVAKYQHLGISESLNYRDKIKDQFKLMYNLTGNEQYNTRFLSHQVVGAKRKTGSKVGPFGGSDTDFDANRNFFEAQHDTIVQLQEQYPDAGLQTWSQMSEKRNAELKQMNIDLQKLQDRSQTSAVAAGNVASMGAYFMDPELLATLPFSGGASVGNRIAANAWRSFKIESGLAAISETAIAPKVYEFQHQIGNEEYGLKDAAIRIMSATLAAGVIRAGGSVTIDLSKIGIAKAKLIKQGKTDEAHVLDYYAKLQEDAKTVESFIHDAEIAANPKEYARPVKAIEAAIAALKKSIKDAKAVLSKRDLDTDSAILKGQKKELAEKELQLEVLTKEQHQYLLSRNNKGSTKADQFFSAHIAAQSKVAQAFEKGETVPQKDLDDLLSVDESQILALAKRMIGDDSQGVGLDEFIRLNGTKVLDKDGGLLKVYHSTFKDFEKFTESGDLGYHFGSLEQAKNRSLDKSLEQLPVWPWVSPRKGFQDDHIQIWDDDWFVGSSKIDDVKGLLELEKTRREYVLEMYGDQVKKQFPGGLPEPKMVEAYLSIKNPLRVNKDIGLWSDFHTMGDDLVNDLKIITKDQWNEALSKGEESFNKEQLVKWIEDAGYDGVVYRNEVEGAGDSYVAFHDNQIIRKVDDGVGQPTLIPEKGKPVRLQDLNDAEVAKAELDFKSKQKELNLTPGQYRKAAQTPQRQIVAIGKELEDAMGESIAFLNPGIKDLSKIKNKIKNKGYDGTGDLTDVVRAGFAVKEASDIPQIIEKISKRYEILDEGIVANAAGYIDQKILVRFDNGLVGEIQLWPPHILAAKEGADFVRDVFPKHLQEYVSDMDVPPRKGSGHDLYERQRSLLENGKVKPGKGEEFKALEKAMKDLYSDANRFSKTSWKEALESGRPESRISNGEIISHSPGSDDVRINQPSSKPSDGSTVTAGRPSQLKNAETSLKSNDAINKSSTNIIPKDTDSIKLNEIKINEAQKLIDDLGDDFEMVSNVKDSGKGDAVLEFKTARETFKEIDNEQKLVDDLTKCVGG